MQTSWVVWFHTTNIRDFVQALGSRNSLTCSKQPLSASCMTSRQAGHLALLVCQLRRVSAHEHSWIAACARLARCVLTALLIMVFLSGDGELSTRQLSRWLCRLQCDCSRWRDRRHASHALSTTLSRLRGAQGMKSSGGGNMGARPLGFFEDTARYAPRKKAGHPQGWTNLPRR